MKVNVVVLLSALTCSISLNSYAAISTGLIDGLVDCSKISNDEQRLVCFDKLTKNNSTPLSVVKMSNEPAPQIVNTKSVDVQQVDNFSKEHLKKTKEDKGPDSITATISKVHQLIRGQWVIYLENDQKWQQKDSKKFKLKVGDNIRLQKGSMGAVYLFKKDSHRSIRVKRLK